MPQGPPRDLQELQEQARDDGPVLASSGISRWAQRRAQSIRDEARAAPKARQASGLLSSARVANVYVGVAELRQAELNVSPTANVAVQPSVLLRGVVIVAPNYNPFRAEDSAEQTPEPRIRLRASAAVERAVVPQSFERVAS
jgi:hypothetical protein